jgi:16S rRNA (adenine1518-N6/adenine1519-N6)-dimethyltransferase
MARQRLGQHFLTDPNILRRIAEAACAPGEPLMVEIGPGKGALTQHLLNRAERVVAIELDSALAASLTGSHPRLEVIPGDALKVDLARWPDAPVAGNLPYYVATPIISRVARLGRPAVFLIQKEVAQRIAASPGSRDYGYLSVETQLFAEPELLFTVKPGAFRPPPQVDSAVIRLTPRRLFPDLETDRFLAFASAAFRHKRKTLRNNLAPLFPADAIEGQPEKSLRAEQLSLAEFVGLYARLLTCAAQ